MRNNNYFGHVTSFIKTPRREIQNSCPDNNIVHLKRNTFPVLAENDVARRRELENIKFASGIQPSCMDFGPLREQQCPEYFFCGGCKEWDN